MAEWVDLDALHTPTPGVRPPAAWGAGIVNNLDLLASLVAKEVLTSETTTSDTYTDLSTVGPTVTVETGERAIVLVTAWISNATDLAGGLMSYAISGASTVAASDSWAAFYTSPASASYSASAIGLGIHENLTAGVNVFTAKYRRGGGTTAGFLRRKMLVVPLR